MDNSIDVILFDFGGVFTASPFTAVVTYASTLGVEPRQLTDIVFGSYHADTDHPWHQLERGQISLEQAREDILAAGSPQGAPIDIYEVFAAMAADMTGDRGVNMRLVDYVRELRGKYTLGIVTNNLKEFSDGWRGLIPVAELFDFVVDSSEVGMRKPNPAIYEHALQQAGACEPGRALFLDDFLGNVDAAAALGMHALHVDGDEHKTIRDLRELLGN
jgi:putative hydrolase of the HAD superfamily